MSERLRELLLKAVHTLEPEEQEEVLGAFLIGGWSTTMATQRWMVPHTPPTASHERAELASQVSSMLAVASGDLKLLPVRLPTTDYERLRAWSREHGFSMAVIIRTLVERFLVSQKHTAGTGAGSSSPAPS